MAKKVEKKKRENTLKNTAKRKAAVLAALEKSLGIVTRACRQAKVGRTAFYEWCKNDPDFKSQVDDITQIALDFVEEQHYELIKEKNPASIIFHLKTKGKSRGYTEKTEIEHSGGIDIDVTKLTDLELAEIVAGKR